MNGGGGGGGGSYMSIRDMPIDDDIIIRDAVVSTELSDDETATYNFQYDIEATENCTPHGYYWHIIPNRLGEISDFRAWDGDGGLESSCSEFDAHGNIKTEYKIKYRAPMEFGRRVKLSFTFTTPASLINASSGLRSILFFSDYLSYTVQCESLRYELTPPLGYVFYRTSKSHLTPVVDQGGTNPHTHPIVLQFGIVPPRTPAPVQVVLRSSRRIDRKRATPIMAALISIYLSAAAGALFSQNGIWVVYATILVAIVGLLYYFYSIRRQ